MNAPSRAICAIALACFCSTSVSAQTAGEWLQGTTVRLGYSHVAPNSSATDAVGPFLPGPPSG